MNRSFLFISTALAAPLLAIAFSTPLAADTPCDARLMSGSIAQLSPTRLASATLAFLIVERAPIALAQSSL